MKLFTVTVHTTVKETYYVEAADADAAEDAWSDSEPVYTDALDYEIIRIEETQ